LLGGALLTAFAMLALAPAALAVTPYTWSGGANTSGTAPQWSNSGNWSSGTAPAPSSEESFSFPALPAGCSTCYQSEDDVSGVTADSLAFAPRYQLYGLGLGLGAGGLSFAVPAGGTGGLATISTPISINDNQSWTVTGTGTSGSGVDFAPYFSGPNTTNGTGDITDPGSHTVTANLGQKAGLEIDSSAEVGTFDAVGASGGSGFTGSSAANNGTLTVTKDLNGIGNGTVGNPVNLTDVAFAVRPGFSLNGPAPSTISLGPLTATGASLQIGEGTNPAGTLAVNGGVTLDSNTATTFDISSGGATPGTNYPQLTAGQVALGGTLALEGSVSGPPGNCPTITPGQSDTLITTTGTLSGTFSNVPNGTVLDNSLHLQCGGAPTSIPVRINYTAHTVTMTFLDTSTTTLSASPTAAVTNQPVKLTATVTPSKPTSAVSGTVAFINGSGPVPGCSAKPVSQTSPHTATCTTSFPSGQQHIGEATFTPDSNSQTAGSYGPSSGVISVSPSSTAVKLSVTAARVPDNKPPYTYFNAKAVVTPSYGGNTQPTGNVAFYEDGTEIAKCTPSPVFGVSTSATTQQAQAGCYIVNPPSGLHSFTAKYLGDSNFKASPTSTTAKVNIPSLSTAPGTGTAHVGSVKTSGTSAKVPVSCAKGGPSCAVTVQITATEKLKGKRVVGVSARKHKKAKIHKKVVVLGKARVTLAAGQKKTVKVSLNGTGKRLLAKHKRLKTKLKVTSKTAGGKTKTVANKTVTFKKATKKKHKKKHKKK
jgi:hypothetical protein